MQLTEYLNLIVIEYIPPGLLSFFIGYLFSSNTIRISLNVVIGLFCVFLITAGYNTFNAIYDKDMDKINKPHRPIPKGTISEKSAFLHSVLLLGLPLLLGLLINSTFLLVCLVAIALCIIYSYPRLYVKKAFIFGTIAATSLYAILFPLLGWALFPKSPIPIGIIAFLFVFGLGSGILKDFEDIEGDLLVRYAHTTPCSWP